MDVAAGGPDLVVVAVEELRQTRSGWRQRANTGRR
jgi:hypothetical protein